MMEPISFRGEKCWCGELAKVARQSLLGGDIKWECDEHGLPPVEEARLTTSSRPLSLVPPRPGPVRLNLGAGTAPMEGWTNCDLHPAPGIDLVFDLMETWPIADNSIQDVYASHVLEHVPDPRQFFKELWRVCQPNASVIIRVPYGASNLGMSDIEHVRPWYATSFCSLQPEYVSSSRCLQHAGWEWPFGTDLVQLRLNNLIASKFRHWWWRIWIGKWIPHLWNAIEEVQAYLYVLKSPEAIDAYRSRPDPVNLVRISYVAYQHEVYGQPLGEKPGLLINISDGSPARQATYKV